MRGNDPHPILVSTFYQFHPLANPSALKAPLQAAMKTHAVRGTITLAHEGVNATIAGTQTAIETLLEEVRTITGVPPFAHRESTHRALPFGRSKVKVKRELISLGAPADPSVCVGEYVPPHAWNALITSPDVITIDTRNDYEYGIGHFAGALNPATRNFKQMVAFTHTHLGPMRTPRVAMYCTGGIRCEKYSAYLLTQGFREVYHLQGGILAYLEVIPEADSLWQGECYVFDDRVAVGHGLVPSAEASMCLGCGRPLYAADRADAHYIEGEQCGKCANSRHTRRSHA
jgi:UPF0176 protein